MQWHSHGRGSLRTFPAFRTPQSGSLTCRVPLTATCLLSRLEKEDCDLAQVEIDEVFCLVRYVAAEIPAHNAVPSGVVFLVKFLKKTDVGGGERKEK